MPRNAATNRFRIRDYPASLNFSGASDKIDTGSDFIGTSDFTVSCWINPNNLAGSTPWTIVDNGNFLFRVTTTSSIPRLQASSDGSTLVLSATASIVYNRWQHVVVTRTSAGVVNFYINGVLNGTADQASGTPASGSTNVIIGNNNAGTRRFSGRTNEACFWNRILTTNEISDLCFSGSVPSSSLLRQFNLTTGAGTVAVDSSANLTNGTITGATFSADVPMKARKASVNANMVKNGDFEYAPPFTAATTTATRFIDGTAGGSTTNDLFMWSIEGSNSAGSVAARFDTSNVNSGTYSMKVSTTATASACDVRIVRNITAANILQYGIRVTPNTDYDVSFYMQTVANSGSATTGAHLRIGQYTSAGAAVTSTDSTKIQTTTGLTRYTFRFTTSSTTSFLVPGVRVVGNDGAATLIMDAWFDDVTITPVYPEGRVPANGNLVKNFDFEVAPTFVAATNVYARWIDGTASGSTTNATYKWATSLAGTAGVSFDSSTSRTGAYSLKVSTLAAASDATGTNLRGTTAASVRTNGYPVLPSTNYTVTYWMKTNYVSGDSSNGAHVRVSTFTGDGSSITSVDAPTQVKTTTDWTQYSFTFTTGATANYVQYQCRVVGNSGAATLIMDAWFDDIYLAKTEIAPVAQASATGTFTISDYQYLGGKDATAVITITDYTLMTGGSLDVLGGGIVITEGVDFDAETSNDVTASNLATAFNTAVGETIATVVGAVITFTIPGSNDGAPMEWSGSGVTPASTAFSGGFDRTSVYVNALFRTFGDDTSQGSSNDEAASNLATNFQGQGINAVAVGNVVTITAASPGSAGNTTTISVVGRDAGPLSGGITPSGATLTGGADAVAGQYPGRIPIT